MWHIIVRQGTHLVSCGFIMLTSFFMLSYLSCRYERVGKWVSSRWEHILGTCVLLTWATATLREPYDLYFGNQELIKTPFDQAGWIVWPVLWAWGLYRFKMR